MADHGIFIGWSDVIVSRERQAEKVFGEAIAFMTDLQTRGSIESFEPVFLRPHGGDLGGFMLVRGERDALQEVLVSPEWARLSSRTQAISSHSLEMRLNARSRRRACSTLISSQVTGTVSRPSLLAATRR